MRPARMLPVALALLLAAAPLAAQHHSPHPTQPAGTDKVDYDPQPGGGDPNPPPGCAGIDAKVQINGSATAFTPSTVTIDAGQPVCWTWSNTAFAHSVKADDGSFTSGQPDVNGTFQRTFTAPGTYGYFCQVHGSTSGGMRGTVVVRDTAGGGGGGDPQPGAGPGTLQFNPAAYTVDEDAGTVTLTVERVDGADGKVTVKVATGTGSASKGKDFLPRHAVLTWNDRDHAPKSFTVPIKNDSTIERDETFAVKLTKPTAHAHLGTSSAVVTIHDDDAPSCNAAAAVAPVALKVTGQSGREIRLRWSDSAGARAVHVERRQDGGDFDEVGVVAAGVGAFVDSGLPAGTTFEYRLRGEGVDGSTAYSEAASGATDGAIGPCAADALCLGNGRFEARVRYRSADGEALRPAARASSPQAPRSGLFALAAAGELQGLINVVDGCAVNDHYWVYLAAIADVELDIAVRDTLTGSTWVFHNPAGKVADVVRDVDAFRGCP